MKAYAAESINTAHAWRVIDLIAAGLTYEEAEKQATEEEKGE